MFNISTVIYSSTLDEAKMLYSSTLDEYNLQCM